MFDHKKINNYLTRKQRHLDKRMKEYNAMKDEQKTMFKGRKKKKQGLNVDMPAVFNSIDFSSKRMEDS